MRNGDLRANLRLICSFERSVSDVCRKVGINRQQFNKYLNGSTRPSANNLQRIGDYFAIDPAKLLLPADEFSATLNARGRSVPGTRGRLSKDSLFDAFRSNRQGLRRYLGYYHTHCHAFSWNGYVLQGLTRLYELEQTICTRTIERMRDPVDGTRFRSRYDGQAAYLGDRIYVIEHESLADDAMTETILGPARRSRVHLLRGVTFGLSSAARQPAVSRCVWKFLGPEIDHRAALRTLGIFPLNSPRLDGNVMRLLGEVPMPNERLRIE